MPLLAVFPQHGNIPRVLRYHFVHVKQLVGSRSDWPIHVLGSSLELFFFYRGCYLARASQNALTPKVISEFGQEISSGFNFYGRTRPICSEWVSSVISSTFIFTKSISFANLFVLLPVSVLDGTQVLGYLKYGECIRNNYYLDLHGEQLAI